MRRLATKALGFGAASLAVVLHSSPALACAACFGKSDSALARGMNMGIFSLLAVVVGVLGGVAGFFIYLARRSSKMEAEARTFPVSETINRS
jgi:hypothetical protein